MANVPLLLAPNYGQGGLNFLQLVQRLQQECATTGTPVTTTVAQVGDVKRLVDWISSAWMDIQNEKPDWFFMRTAVSFQTVPGQQLYTAAQTGLAGLATYKRDSFRQYRLSAGYGSEVMISYLPYDSFRDLYQFGAMRSTSQLPVIWSLDTSKNFLLGPIPDDVYMVNGEGYAMPTEFANDSDRPSLPAHYHMAIVWRALMYYGQYESAPEAYSHGQNEFLRLMDKLYVDQLPVLAFGPPLA